MENDINVISAATAMVLGIPSLAALELTASDFRNSVRCKLEVQIDPNRK